MSKKLSESGIVSKVAELAGKRICRRAIRSLQRMGQTLSGDDSGLVSVWEELCVQRQHQESIFWDLYDDTVRLIMEGEVESLPDYEVEALWLQTDSGIDWSCDDEEERDRYPIWHEEVVDYIIHEYVYAAACDWRNERIRTYLERSMFPD